MSSACSMTSRQFDGGIWSRRSAHDVSEIEWTPIQASIVTSLLPVSEAIGTVTSGSVDSKWQAAALAVDSVRSPGAVADSLAVR